MVIFAALSPTIWRAAKWTVGVTAGFGFTACDFCVSTGSGVDRDRRGHPDYGRHGFHEGGLVTLSPTEPHAEAKTIKTDLLFDFADLNYRFKAFHDGYHSLTVYVIQDRSSIKFGSFYIFA